MPCVVILNEVKDLLLEHFPVVVVQSIRMYGCFRNENAAARQVLRIRSEWRDLAHNRFGLDPTSNKELAIGTAKSLLLLSLARRLPVAMIVCEVGVIPGVQHGAEEEEDHAQPAGAEEAPV